ncbi:MAG: GH32 C-terminal domain-containing protein [Gemmataceae bacterium]
MFAEPIQEIQQLHKKKHTAKARLLNEDNPAMLKVAGDLVDVRATFAIGKAQTIGLDIGGNRITYDVKERKLNGAPLNPVDGKVMIQVLVDRPMLEICGNKGRVFLTTSRQEKGNVENVKAFATDGEARLLNLEVYELKSIWKNSGME